MDRLFRKRTNSRSDELEQKPATLRKQPSMTDSLSKKRMAVKDAFADGQPSNQPAPCKSRISERAPSLNVDIRNSLMLPGLSQRFSVLLPSLSSAPESSIRSLLASQRGRDGPSLTEAEEELLFAEMRDNVSSPALSSDNDSNGPVSAPLDTPSPWPASPPPTSNSFSSFRTFGVNDSTATDNGVKVKSYGFSGNSSFRDEVYMRKAKKGMDGRKSDASTLDTVESEDQSSPARSPSPDSAPLSPPSAHEQVHSHRKRQSMLAGLTPAQVKRISMALGEIEGRLQRPMVARVQEEDEEETLETGSEHVTPTTRHARLPSDPRSEASEVSSAFPYKDSPVGSHFSEGPSPSRLPPSPRTHNLAAQVAPPTAPIPQPSFRAAAAQDGPRPIMTPSRTQPARHKPSSSTSTIIGSPVPLYIPGQPRPVGSMHRSDGSTSSRAATPTQASPAYTTSSGQDEASPIPPRGSSLGRSQSVTQPHPKQPANNAHSRAQSLDAESSSRRAPASTRPSSVIEEEADEPELDLPEIQTVSGRYTVSDTRQNDYDSGNLGLGIDTQSLKRRAVSQQGTIESSTFPSQTELRSLALHRTDSRQSDGSTFEEPDIRDPWDRSVQTNEEPAPDVAEGEHACRVLRQTSGLDPQQLSAIQGKLVQKAKMERMILRGATETTPELPMSPQIHPPSHPLRKPSVGSRPIVQPPPSAFPRTMPQDITERVNPMHSISRPAPPPPSDSLETPLDEMVATPQSAEPSAKASQRTAPEEDPDVRRDFEARIAAATAALNRTPSTGPGLARKNTKKGALKISSPTLVSTSAKLGGAPVSSPIDHGVAKALEKASGSGSKMSARWRKLGFKRGPSVSNTAEIYSPPATAQPPKLQDPILLRATSPIPPTPLSAPINMTPSSNESPDLDAFRFPRSSEAPHPIARSKSTKVDSASSRPSAAQVRRGRSDEKPFESIPEGDAVPTPKPSVPTQPSPRALHSPSSSTDSAVINFIAAGRAVGLNDEQLNDMLIAKGMLNRSHGSSSTAPTSATVPSSQTPHRSPVSAPVSRVPSTGSAEKAKGGGAKALFRSLSRKKSKAALTPDAVSTETATDPTPTRTAVVRRTLLLPQAAADAALAPGSPGSSVGKASLGGRKLSIKRKPVNLSREDEALVNRSPHSHGRKASVGTASSTRSAEVKHHDLLPGHKEATRGNDDASSDNGSMRRSSTGGSFYDLYSGTGEEDASETLLSPTIEATGSPGPAGKRSTRAVEITEYADGKVVWSLVDALRDPDDFDPEEIQFGTPGHLHTHSHSSSTSYSSRRDSRRDSAGDVFANASGYTGIASNTAGLNFRHKARGENAPRPPTNVYYTSQRDIGDLIDHLSSDLNASRGRIDIRQHEGGDGPQPMGSPFSAGQFEDAPSPYRPALARPAFGGREADSPRRQLFFGQAQGQNLESKVSPSAFSFASSGSGMPGDPPRTVEDRLQALLDRLQQGGGRR